MFDFTYTLLFSIICLKKCATRLYLKSVLFEANKKKNFIQNNIQKGGQMIESAVVDGERDQCGSGSKPTDAIVLCS